MEKSKEIIGLQHKPFIAIAKSLECIPRTIAQNSGADTIRVLTELRGKHLNKEELHWGINGNTGKVDNMKEIGVLETFNVKSQLIKTAVESCCMLL